MSTDEAKTRAEPLDHDCPTCPSKAYERCQWPHGPPAAIALHHARRWFVAQEAAKAKVASGTLAESVIKRAVEHERADVEAMGRTHELDIAEGRVEDWRRWAGEQIKPAPIRAPDKDLRRWLDELIAEHALTAEDALGYVGDSALLEDWRARIDGFLHSSDWRQAGEQLTDDDRQERLRFLGADYRQLRAAETARAGAPAVTEASTRELARALLTRVRARLSR